MVDVIRMKIERERMHTTVLLLFPVKLVGVSLATEMHRLCKFIYHLHSPQTTQVEQRHVLRLRIANTNNIFNCIFTTLRPP